jgi:hypothetical protein
MASSRYHLVEPPVPLQGGHVATESRVMPAIHQSPLRRRRNTELFKRRQRPRRAALSPERRDGVLERTVRAVSGLDKRPQSAVVDCADHARFVAIAAVGEHTHDGLPHPPSDDGGH